MSYSERDGQVILDPAIEPMAEVLLYRMTRGGRLTDRDKCLGQALFRFIASRSDVLLLPAAKPKKGRWTGLRL
jgi:hypothetical protein